MLYPLLYTSILFFQARFCALSLLLATSLAAPLNQEAGANVHPSNQELLKSSFDQVSTEPSLANHEHVQIIPKSHPVDHQGSHNANEKTVQVPDTGAVDHLNPTRDHQELPEHQLKVREDLKAQPFDGKIETTTGAGEKHNNEQGYHSLNPVNYDHDLSGHQLKVREDLKNQQAFDGKTETTTPTGNQQTFHNVDLLNPTNNQQGLPAHQLNVREDLRPQTLDVKPQTTGSQNPTNLDLLQPTNSQPLPTHLLQVREESKPVTLDLNPQPKPQTLDVNPALFNLHSLKTSPTGQLTLDASSTTTTTTPNLDQHSRLRRQDNPTFETHKPDQKTEPNHPQTSTEAYLNRKVRQDILLLTRPSPVNPDVVSEPKPDEKVVEDHTRVESWDKPTEKPIERQRRSNEDHKHNLKQKPEYVVRTSTSAPRVSSTSGHQEVSTKATNVRKTRQTYDSSEEQTSYDQPETYDNFNSQQTQEEESAEDSGEYQPEPQR